MARKRSYLLGNNLSEIKHGKPAPYALDLAVLMRTRLLVQARSGGGKSYLLRRLLEQTHGAVQQLIIDVEGEFATLREKYDYVLAGKGGDTPADPRSARLLAERLLELKASAILDLYELKMPDRIRFVHLFLDTIVNAPKHLWHPVIIVIDEAHIFCPQQDRSENEAAAAVIDLLTRGRKRGFCPILATQRLSKLHKDAAAECQNKMIGGTTLDVDQKRAADELGFADKEQRLDLRRLKPGQFFAFGPALSTDVARVQIGSVITQHPKPGGSRMSFKAPPPRRHIKALLPKLADLPAEEEAMELTLRESRKKLTTANETIVSLEHQLKVMKLAKTKPAVNVIDKKTVQQVEYLAKLVKQINLTHLNGSIGKLTSVMAGIQSSVDKAMKQTVDEHMTVQGQAFVAPPSANAKIDNIAVPFGGATSTTGRDNAENRMLAALKQYGVCSTSKLGALTHISPKKSTFRVALNRLRKRGCVTGDREAYRLTPAGLVAAADVPALPTGASAIEGWRRKIPGGLARQMFDKLLAAGRDGLAPDALGDRTKSTFRVTINRLKRFGVVNGGGSRYFINPELL